MRAKTLKAARMSPGDDWSTAARPKESLGLASLLPRLPVSTLLARDISLNTAPPLAWCARAVGMHGWRAVGTTSGRPPRGSCASSALAHPQRQAHPLPAIPSRFFPPPPPHFRPPRLQCRSTRTSCPQSTGKSRWTLAPGRVSSVEAELAGDLSLAKLSSCQLILQPNSYRAPPS